jgi:hypothetical protein
MPAEVPPLQLTVAVTEGERDLIVAAANRLSLCLGDGTAPGWPIRIRFVAPDAPLPPEPSVAILASLAIDAGRSGDPFESIAAGWRDRIAGWRAAAQPILLLNLFRHVADANDRPARAPHLRRLNLLAIELSRQSGAGIVDIDRAFALIGGRTLGSDYRGRGAFTIEVAAQAIVAVLLGCLDDKVAPDRVQAAGQRNGGREALAAIIARHIGAAA